jgi:hypothetical protein
MKGSHIGTANLQWKHIVHHVKKKNSTNTVNKNIIVYKDFLKTQYHKSVLTSSRNS